MIFPPISYMTAEKMKKMIQRTGAAYKEQSGYLSNATLDRAENAITYRVFGCEQERQLAYEENLTSYEKSAVKANIWNSVMPPGVSDYFHGRSFVYPVFRPEKCSWNRLEHLDHCVLYDFPGMFCEDVRKVLQCGEAV